MKHLPLTIVGPVNATRPGAGRRCALAVFSEQLNGFQWIGVALALTSLVLLSRSGRREGVDFRHNVWILCLAAAAVTGRCQRPVRQIHHDAARSGLRAELVQSLSVGHDGRRHGLFALVPRRALPFRWLGHSADFGLFSAPVSYFCALREPDAMISVVSMVRRGSVVVSFLCGALLFGERNLRAKAVDLGFVLLGMLFLWLGSR